MRSQLIAGRYRLEDEVGAGGMGMVWRATDLELDRTVALKRAHTGGTGALREAKAAATLQHPHLVTLFDVLREDGDLWLVMEYLPAKSLRDRVLETGPLSGTEVRTIGAQLADALAALHRAGTVHADVKPGNVLLTEDGTAKLIDFGIARADWADATLTGAEIIGTPAYLAPELVKGGGPSPASDLFSLGATLFYAAEGTSPYGEAEAAAQLLGRAARARMLAPRRADGELGRLLTELLRKDPGRRPEATAVAERLGQPTGTAPHRRFVPRRRGFAAGAAVALVVIVAFGVVELVRGSGGTEHPAAANPPGLGDRHSADPCSLTDVRALGRFGTAEQDPLYGNFDRCDVLVTKGSARVDVEVQLTEGDKARQRSGAVREVGALRVVDQPGQSEQCERTILLPGRTGVDVTAKLDEATDDRLCAMADTATGTALRVLNENRLGQRRFPAESLATVDACTLLDAKALGTVPGIDANDPDRGYVGWDCSWDSTTEHLSLRLSYDHDQPFSAADGTPMRLAGHPAVLRTEFDGEGTCAVQLVNRTVHDANADPVNELLDVELRGELPQRRLCGYAGTLAGAAAPNLPGKQS